MYAYRYAADMQSLSKCVEESRLSRHQEQASSNTCSQPADQHIQQQREHRLPEHWHLLLFDDASHSQRAKKEEKKEEA